MERKTKYTVALLVAVIAMGCILLAPQALAGNGHRVKVDEDQEDLHKLPKYNWGKQKPKLQLWGPLLRNGTLETLTGKAVALDGRILIVEASGDYVNVVVPKRWIVVREAMDVEELFEEDGPLEYGETLTISLLKYEISKQIHSVTFLFAYKIVQDGTTARAILPFNIKASS